MDIIYLLIPISLAILLLAIGIFFWAVKNKQFDDLESPPYQILYDDQYSRRELLEKDENHD